MPTYLLYAQHFDIIPQPTATPPICAAVPDPTTGLYIFKHALHTDRSHIGDIIPLPHCCIPIQLVPCFSPKADTRLTAKNSMEWSQEFFLNVYFDKNIFQYLQSSCP